MKLLNSGISDFSPTP